MRRAVALVVATLAVLAGIGSIELVVFAAGALNPPAPQQPGNLQCDNNYSMASDPVCVASRNGTSVRTVSDRDLLATLLLIMASLVLSLVLAGLALKLFRGNHLSGTPSPLTTHGP
jgi:hypothetical protein